MQEVVAIDSREPADVEIDVNVVGTDQVVLFADHTERIWVQTHQSDLDNLWCSVRKRTSAAIPFQIKVDSRRQGLRVFHRISLVAGVGWLIGHALDWGTLRQ